MGTEFDISEEGEYVMVPRETYALMHSLLVASVPSASTSTFRVRVTNHGSKKIQLIKATREITGWGLMESKCFVEGNPTHETFDVQGTQDYCEAWIYKVLHVSPGAKFAIEETYEPTETLLIENPIGDPHELEEAKEYYDAL